MDRESYNEVATEQVPILRVFSVVAAIVLGVVVGYFIMIPLWVAIANITVPLQPYLPSWGTVLLLITILLGSIWFINRMLGRANLVNFATVFLFVLPWPSVIILIMWQRALDEQFPRTPPPQAHVESTPPRYEAKVFGDITGSKLLVCHNHECVESHQSAPFGGKGPTGP